jgi:hypothetical protein
MELLGERWAPILGYIGRYEVSDHGRVRSLARWRRGKAGALVPIAGRIMRLHTKNPRNNRTLPYVEIKLRDGSPRKAPCKSFLVHRLVAQAFLGELYDGCQVDHIDGDPSNNLWTNLRILSAQEHGLLHPCIADKSRNEAFQAAAQAKLRAMRDAGEIIGRYKIKAKEVC